jgi:hypothetical protein
MKRGDAMSRPRTEPAVGRSDGRHDFDFLVGRWRIANRRLDDPLAEVPTSWQEFEATAESRPILGGLGNCDTYAMPDFPRRPGFQAFALRLYAPETGLWRIWWASTVGRGLLDTPLVGFFRDGEGRFECDDVVDGRALKVRFVWSEITPSSARWAQSFSIDDGRSYEDNWIMQWTRID